MTINASTAQSHIIHILAHIQSDIWPFKKSKQELQLDRLEVNSY